MLFASAYRLGVARIAPPTILARVVVTMSASLPPISREAHFDFTTPALAEGARSINVLTLLLGVSVIGLAALAISVRILRKQRIAAEGELEAARAAQQQLQAAHESAQASASTQQDLRQLVHELGEHLLVQQQSSVSNATAVLERRAETQSATMRHAFETDSQNRLEVLRSEIAPLRHGLTTLARQLTETRTHASSDIAAFGAMLQRVTEEQGQHREETRQLQRTLRSSHVRGQYGELTLQRTLEHAGMQQHVHYLAQTSDRDEEGGMRPDIILLLPQHRCLVIDSKAPLESLANLMVATTAADRTTHAESHARRLRAHVEALASKNYAARLRAANVVTEGQTVIEAVLLFLPSQPALDVALRQDPTLLAHAFDRNVYLVTPSTLLLAVSTVAQLWRHERLTEQTHEVLRLGAQLYDRVATMVSHVVSLRKALSAAVDAYNSFAASLETRVLSSTRRFKDLGVPSQRNIDRVPRIETLAREPGERLLALADTSDEDTATDTPDSTEGGDMTDRAA